jgi:hypothetical protein
VSAIIKIFNQEESESGKQENRKDRGFECGGAFNSLAPLTRSPAAEFGKNAEELGKEERRRVRI